MWITMEKTKYTFLALLLEKSTRNLNKLFHKFSMRIFFRFLFCLIVSCSLSMACAKFFICVLPRIFMCMMLDSFGTLSLSYSCAHLFSMAKLLTVTCQSFN